MFPITPTLVWYYYICPREVWLMSHRLTPEQDDNLVELGRIFHKYGYKRNKKDISLEGMKIDMIRREGDKYVVCEVKKSSRFEFPAKMQLVYSLYILKNMGIYAKGELLIPTEKKKIEVELNEELEKEIEKVVLKIKEIMAEEKPPPPKKIKYCRKCAYRYFCWA